ncbi:MAG: TIR domain-containing protein [Sciscionella sp.]
MGREQIYDIAVSFAGEQRKYVAKVVAACKDRDLKIFYDKDIGNEWWGKSFIREQRNVYGSQTRYFVPFISAEYLAKPIPIDEFSAAMMTAVKQGDGYILPVLVGDVQVPADLLHPHVHYLRTDDYTPEQLADELAKRVGKAVAAGQEPRDVGTVVSEALEFRMPKVVPADFSKYQELQVAFDYLGDQFQAVVSQLKSLGFVGTVMRRDDNIKIRIERQGDTVYSLDIAKGGSFGDDRLEFGVGHHRTGSSGINGWALPFFDKQAGQPKLELMDMSLLSSMGGGERVFSKEKFFDALWDRIVEQLERP